VLHTGLVPALHAFPQAPQLFRSVAVSAHAPEQHVPPVPHAAPLVTLLHAVVLAAGLQL
jgi:hypothetical protein